MISFPNGRITLGLYVKAKRGDGFHDIETVMLPVSICDALEFVPATNGKTKIITTGIPIPGDLSENLVWKAYQLVQKELRIHSGPKSGALPPLRIHLRKGIPSGSGLAGGSSNGAFMLLMLNRYFRLNLTQSRLHTLSIEMGSDCPFFLHNKTMLVTGRGETIESINTPDLSDYCIIIIIPPIHLSTSYAYKKVNPVSERTPLNKILELPVSGWQTQLTNDFEDVIFQEHPYLEEIKTRLLNHGAVYASLSGSGSAIFGLFTDSKVVFPLQKAFPDCRVGLYRGFHS